MENVKTIKKKNQKKLEDTKKKKLRILNISNRLDGLSETNSIYSNTPRLSHIQQS